MSDKKYEALSLSIQIQRLRKKIADHAGVPLGKISSCPILRW